MTVFGNILTNIPGVIPDELTEILVQSGNVRIERIVSKGHTTPDEKWYDQEEEEFVLVLKGEAKILFEKDNSEVILKPGDYINISAHLRHRVTYTSAESETIWLAVFYSP